MFYKPTETAQHLVAYVLLQLSAVLFVIMMVNMVGPPVTNVFQTNTLVPDPTNTPTPTSNLWVVTSLADTSGTPCPDASNCTLRQAMTQAAWGDRITFAVSGMITLSSTLPTVQKSVTIDGTGQSVTINAAGANVYGIMQVDPNGILSLNNLTLSNAHNSSGAIYSDQGTLNISNDTFSGNSGGALVNVFGGTLNVVNSTFSGNSATGSEGGAIWSYGLLNVANSTFFNNSTSGSGYGGNGGTISNAGGTAKIVNSTFSGNSALLATAVQFTTRAMQCSSTVAS